MPNQCIDGAFCRRVGRDCAHDGVRRERRDENDAASFRHDREELLHEKEGRPDIDCEALVEIFDRSFLDGCCSRDPCIGNQNVEAIADDAAGLLGKPVCAVSGGEICRYGVRTTTRLLYVGDNTIGFIPNDNRTLRVSRPMRYALSLLAAFAWTALAPAAPFS